MRWDGLFGDLERRFDAGLLAEADAMAQDEARARHAGLGLRDRLLGSGLLVVLATRGGEVARLLDAVGADWVAGRRRAARADRPLPPSSAVARAAEAELRPRATAWTRGRVCDCAPSRGRARPGSGASPHDRRVAATSTSPCTRSTTPAAATRRAGAASCRSRRSTPSAGGSEAPHRTRLGAYRRASRVLPCDWAGIDIRLVTDIDDEAIRHHAVPSLSSSARRASRSGPSGASSSSARAAPKRRRRSSS